MPLATMRAMKLFLTWLLGVPVLVTTMVMAQSMLMQDQKLGAHTRPGTQLCVSQGQPHDVTPLVPQQGNRVPCNRLSVQ
jgi:hypothetical protein